MRAYFLHRCKSSGLSHPFTRREARCVSCLPFPHASLVSHVSDHHCRLIDRILRLAEDRWVAAFLAQTAQRMPAKKPYNWVRNLDFPMPGLLKLEKLPQQSAWPLLFSNRCRLVPFKLSVKERKIQCQIQIKGMEGHGRAWRGCRRVVSCE